MTLLNATYEIVNSQAEEDASEALIVIRQDLLPPAPPPAGEPILAYELLSETNFASAAISVPDNDNLDFGTGNFKISLEFKLSTLNNGAHQTLLSKGTSLNNAWYVMYESLTGGTFGHIIISTLNNNAVINFDADINDTTNYHKLEIERIDGTTKVYLDDVEKASTALSLVDTTAPLLVGAWNYLPAGHRFLGWMRNLVIIKG